ncbi:HlyD family secretion protein [Ereboglobus sp. PH5-10]|uniref:HlyD family secretion protein n=1 Tax=Ereboglobus sp. PH5-10 TaxID=2940629 RepID=UPI0024075B8A|nr:efflux RND transporter periplasmic adaptor subunit [Ereboglobus sp. PH5-10]MDF9826854.1 HlyD family secretion protein [Ereboglobus sp. PH5-10]
MTQKASAKPSRHKVLAVILLLGIAAILAVGIWLSSRPIPGQIQGMIDTDEIRVAAKAPGRLETVLAAEGDSVRAGQILFTLSNAELDAKLREVSALETSVKALQAKAEKGAQDEDIASARAVWQAHQAAADVAAKTAERLKRLFSEGVISEQKRDEAVANAAATAESAEAARKQYEKALAGTRVEDKAAVDAQVAQAGAAVAAVKSLEEELKTPAPIDGQITKRYANVGEIVPPGFPVFSMINPDDLWVSFNVRENQFSGMEIGKIVEGSVPALDGKRMQFKVYFISPQGAFATWRAVRQSEGYDVKTFEIRARPVSVADSEKGKLRPGMSVLFDWPQGGR